VQTVDSGLFGRRDNKVVEPLLLIVVVTDDEELLLRLLVRSHGVVSPFGFVD
jgi:hypothetical protein